MSKTVSSEDYNNLRILYYAAIERAVLANVEIDKRDKTIVELQAQLEAEAWVSVEDRLPDCQQGMYLTLYLFWDKHVCHKVTAWLGNKFVDLGLHPVPVTHWRPLPSPPEEATAHSTPHSTTIETTTKESNERDNKTN